MEIPQKLKEYIDANRAPLPPVTDPDEPLQMDSLALIRMVAFLENEMGITINDEELLAEKIETYFGDGSSFGMRFRYSRVSEPLGTGGVLKLAEAQLGDPVLVLNGDSSLEWDTASLLNLMTTKDASVVIALKAMPDVSR